MLGKLFQEPAISGEVSTFIDRTIPYPEYADRLKSLIFSRVDELVDYRNIAGAPRYRLFQTASPLCTPQSRPKKPVIMMPDSPSVNTFGSSTVQSGRLMPGLR